MTNIELIYSLCKRRGYVFQSAEIYGGLNAVWDYGPLGVLLKKNVADLWWKKMVNRLDVVGLDSAILSHEEVLKASGHVSAFTDPLVDCLKCRHRFRFEEKNVCPQCGSQKITSPRAFNLMFKTKMGSLEEGGSTSYLRPETAQGIYVNFLNVQVSMRKKIPFGIAQIGKAFRNEITPGPFTFRMREFEQMELQFFIPPNEGDRWFNYWKEQRLNFYKDLNFSSQSIRFHDHGNNDLAHYARKATDIQFQFPFGWKELEGIHDRGDYDLKQHQQHSKKNLKYVDDSGEKYIPCVIETSVGLDRVTLALLCSAYTEEKVKEERRTVLKIPKKLAPLQLAVLPLSKKSSLMERAQKIHSRLSEIYRSDYDETGSIGKRYRRQDEIGTPFSITVDFESLDDQKVTIRDRDTMKQDRVSMEKIEEYLGTF